MYMMSAQGKGMMERVSGEILDAASPMIWTACTTAKRSCSSVWISARSRPATKRSALSAASIMWRMRTASSGRILHLGAAHYLVAKIATEVAGRPQIDLPPAEQPGKLAGDARKSYQARRGARLELNQKIDVAVGPRDALEPRAEQGEAPDAMTLAERGQRRRVRKQGFGHRFPPLQQRRLGELLAPTLARQPRDFRPALHEAVVGERFGCAFFAFAERVKAVGEFAGGLGARTEFRHEIGRRALAAARERADELMHDLPGRQPRVGRRVPVRRKLLGLEQPHFAALGLQNAGFGHRRDARHFRLAEYLGDAVVALGKAVLLEPGEGPPAVGVEVALLLGQRLVERGVDQRQRFAHRDGLAFGVEDFGVARVDRHPRANGRLREIDRRDVAGLQVAEDRKS